jgi:hypothetical protein
MNRVKWDRVIAVLLLLFAPFIIRFLRRTFNFGNLSDLPLGAEIAYSEVKGLILLRIILVSVLFVIKIMKND